MPFVRRRTDDDLRAVAVAAHRPRHEQWTGLGMSQPGTAPTTPAPDPLWYKDAVIYQTHVKAFFDTDGDGTGDFRGLTSRLDYIRELGINCLWILPFYPSPMRDDGYDISDYRNVYPPYGSRRDFRRFVGAAHRRGIRVITELIVNHTSDQHPWFQAARRAPKGSAKRNFYVWSDDDSRFPETRIIFTDTELSNWTWDPVAGQYYWHRFFSHQPDLNHNNPQVVRAMIRVMRFWLDAGVDGLRLDAIPYLCVREGTNNENLPETHAVIKQMRAEVDAHYADRVFLAEANQWPEDVRDYFGDGDECHMAYHFPLMPRMYMALAEEDRHPIVEIMEQTPEIPPNCQWAIFLRNHDELTLEMVSDRERDYMYQTYAADPRMRINVGIRRRLAPLLGNDPDKLRLMVSLLLSMPGSPILYYGDELGMGDNIYLGDRNAVRTPMQWSPDRNAGFSRADPQRLYLPPIMDPVYGYQSVNVEAQSRAPASLLNWTRRVIEVRRQHRVFGRGVIEFLHPGNRKILAYVRRYRPPGADLAAGPGRSGASLPGPAGAREARRADQPDEVLLCVANLARGAQPVELDLAAYAGRVPIELLGQTPFPPIGELPYLLTLPGHGFYWFQLSSDAHGPAWHDGRVAAPELDTIVLPEGWLSLLPERAERPRSARRAMALLQDRVLPVYLGPRRGRTRYYVEPARVMVEAAEPWREWLLMLVRPVASDRVPQGVAQADRSAQEGASPTVHDERLFLPLAIQWQGQGSSLSTVPSAATTIAAVRRQATPGQLFEAFADTGFVRALVQAIGAAERIPLGRGRLALQPTNAFDAIAGGVAGSPLGTPAGERQDAAARLQLEFADNSVVVGRQLLLRMLRGPVPGGQSSAAEPIASDAPGTPSARLHLPEPAAEPPSEPPVEPMVELARQLTEAPVFAKVPALAGHLDYIDPDGERCTLVLLEQYVPNQGDLGCRTAELLRRLCDEYFSAHADDAWRDDPAEIGFEALVERLGAGLAELHLALAAVPGDAFEPEPIGEADSLRFRDGSHALVAQTLERLLRERQSLPGLELGLADELLGNRERIEQVVGACSVAGPGRLRWRVHGDLCLKRVLVAEDRLVVTGAGGPSDAAPAERRRKQPPLRDLGRLLFSVHETVAAVQQEMTKEHPEQADRVAGGTGAWRRHVSERLLAAYAAASASSPLSPFGDGTDGWMRVRLFGLTAALEALGDTFGDGLGGSPGDALARHPAAIGGPAGAILSLVSDAGDSADPP
jgi:maltose alpha-D-glucosyltransferase/alpha-amylase